ncbi:hypothetical protein D0868_00897 [Hortaea werneckii]|uniref:Xylanolytic transcriptional activator regulatory domain-containing protein n=1 Tax=Hortaea werneckii TaxID=91943 RepID=A0A3M6ZJG3_HORWE|nr:hypothetical protein D0868_00897 [Hortaea werneckii]RMY38160.1 hypothetical protein D0866_02797 [Hortaea werneckii]
MYQLRETGTIMYIKGLDGLKLYYKLSGIKCSGDRPTCERCQRKSTECQYDVSSEPVWKLQIEREQQYGDRSVQGQHGQSSHSHSGSSPRNLRPDCCAENGSSRQAESNVECASDEACSLTPSLIAGHEARPLVEAYFAHIHPLRCFGFLHKPSFMHNLDHRDPSTFDEDALLLIMCALGDMFCTHFDGDGDCLPGRTSSRRAQWADRAQHLLYAKIGRISAENLMAAVLLQDYAIRMADWGTAFMLSGLIARMTQALQINLEHSTDILCQDTSLRPDASTKESRRRLMWSCYIADSLIGSGVDQLTLIREEDMKIQLPCSERNFLHQTPCITELLHPNTTLPFVPSRQPPSSPGDNVGIRAHYLRHISIRRRVLNVYGYIKHLQDAKAPWHPDSEFAHLDAECRAWYSNLPASLLVNSTSIYIRKETSQVGALLALHFMFHQTMCDLYRIGTPRLYKLRSPFSFPPEQAAYLRHLQSELFQQAKAIAMLAKEALRHGLHGLADSWIPTIVYDSCRIMLYFATQLHDPNSSHGRSLINEGVPLVRSNMEALKKMRSLHSVSELLFNAAERMLNRLGLQNRGQNVVLDQPYLDQEQDEEQRTAPGTPVQSTPEYVLNPLSIYRMARKSIPEKYAPEKIPSPNSSGQPISQDTLEGQIYQKPILPVNQADSPRSDPSSNPAPTATGPDSFQDVLSLFTEDPSRWDWQPSETVVGSHDDSFGLPPWEPIGSEQQLDAWGSVLPSAW